MSKHKLKLSTLLKNPEFMMSKPQFLSTANPTMPDELLEYILTWDKIKKSPYNNTSYYNEKKDWFTYVDGAIRVSDHWNFYTSSGLHCKSKTPVENNVKWYVGVYDEVNEDYDIIASYPIVDRKTSTIIKKGMAQSKLENKPSPEQIEKWRMFKQSVKNGEVSATIDGVQYVVKDHGFHNKKRYIKVDELEGAQYNFKLEVLDLWI